MEALQESYRYTIEDFYNLPEERRLELIDGELYELYGMAEPTRVHQEMVSYFVTKVNNYIMDKGGNCKVYPAPFGVQLNEEEDTVVEPDVTVICDKDKLTDKGCVGAPDWIIEVVSPSNPGHDYIDKLKLYMDAEVREYWIVNPDQNSVTVYNSSKPYVPQSYTFEDTVKVGIYPDFSVDFKEIMRWIEG